MKNKNGLTFGEKFKIFIKKNSFALAVSGCAILLVVAVVATAIVKTNQDRMPQDDPVQEVTNTNNNNSQPSQPDNVEANSGDTLNFVMPLTNYTMGERTFVNNNVVYFSTLNEWSPHTGVDFKTEDAQEVMSIADGVVESISQSNLDGTVIVIKHTDELKSVYRSLGGEIALSEGDAVKAGDVIGLTATSAREADAGTHLHLEMYENNVAVDPMLYISDK